MNQINNKKINFKIGAIEKISKIISDDDIKMYAKITGDNNPLHLNEIFAKKTRFKGCIAHGLLSAGLISSVLGTKLPGPGSIYLSQELKFLKPVRPGDKITAEVKVVYWNPDDNIIKLETRCFNQKLNDVITGKATMLIEYIGRGVNKNE